MTNRADEGSRRSRGPKDYHLPAGHYSRFSLVDIINVVEAVRCSTKNVADIIEDTSKGKLEVGRKVDFIVLNDKGKVP